jgi:NAD-dependent SIR2 family protein deacetylase
MCKPNLGHKEILKFQEYCSDGKNEMECMLSTQNIDNYHEQLVLESKIMSKHPDKYLEKYGSNPPAAFTPHVYAMHGNVLWMHCNDTDQDHSKNFYPAPKLIEVKDYKNHVPKCSECGKDMEPHSMFFDESYNEHYYRKETIDQFRAECDAVIVVGTALETNFARTICVEHLENEKLLIEVNPNPVIHVGNTYQLIGYSDEALPRMFNAFYKARGAAVSDTISTASTTTAQSVKSTAQKAPIAQKTQPAKAAQKPAVKKK